MVVYSFSQINLYEQCPRKYQYRYLDQLERAFETSPDLILGTSVHGALEWLYQQVNIFNIPIKADLLGKFHELRKNAGADAGEKLIYKGDQHEDDYLRRGEHYLEKYYEMYTPFKDSKIIATELMMNFDLQKKENRVLLSNYLKIVRKTMRTPERTEMEEQKKFAFQKWEKEEIFS